MDDDFQRTKFNIQLGNMIITVWVIYIIKMSMNSNISF